MRNLASKFSDRHANEIKAEGAIIFKAETLAESVLADLNAKRPVSVDRQRYLVGVIRHVCSIARDYHLAAAELVD